MDGSARNVHAVRDSVTLRRGSLVLGPSSAGSTLTSWNLSREAKAAPGAAAVGVAREPLARVDVPEPRSAASRADLRRGLGDHFLSFPAMYSLMNGCDDLTSYWDYGDTREDPIHRIHSYPAKFPAFITTKALRYAEEQGVNVKTVVDVFCGCGTTAVEAKRNGKEFWGCDINPIATLIARVKTHHYRDTLLDRYFEAITEEFIRTESTEIDDTRVTDRMRYWHDQTRVRDLTRLDQAIRMKTPSRSPYRRFFHCGFSAILKPTSRWLSKSIKAQLDPHKSPTLRHRRVP